MLELHTQLPLAVEELDHQTFQQQQQRVEILFFQRSHPLAEVLVAVMPRARLMVLLAGLVVGRELPLLLRGPLGQGLLIKATTAAVFLEVNL
jgi:hypothetical protein